MLSILYSFRRCPYAIRARLAIASSGVSVELREILLRDKPQAFLDASPSATAPCLVTAGGVLGESFDIMRWALAQNDPEGLCDMPDAGLALVETFDGPFKDALDLTKYAVRHPDSNPDTTRADAMGILVGLERQLSGGWLFGERPTLADLAILPFVRQFAMIDKARFDNEASSHVSAWLETFLASNRLASIMQKHAPWQEGDAPVTFP
ncbi:glutathione S-transferase [Aliiroseovarius sp. S1339]|uniref:glutathione S-transferase n=1 Tax=Aliiroseovarius sp. S1339 TaxID=2936990 RepID=UPI0020BF1DC1|nr:glutathione S-transferase [Aliiroseovarius sp. S1339]MCK8463213.1 glutathione S-transferase [Aliiroseovarius sp. S1339]